MSLMYTPYFIPALSAAFISAGAGLYALRSRRRSHVPGVVAFVIMALAVAAWALAYAFQISGTDLPTKILFEKLQYPGMITVPLAWLAFAFHYAAQRRFLQWQWAVPWLIIPALTLLFVLTNDSHQLMWSNVRLDTHGPFLAFTHDHGPWYWVIMAYTYVSLVIGTLVILTQLARLSTAVRPRIVVLVAAVLAPWLANAVYVFDIDPVPHLNITVLIYAITNAVLCWALFHFRLFELVPLARDVVVSSMHDGAIVLDVHHRVVDVNPAALRLLGQVNSVAVLDRPIADVLGTLPSAVAHLPNGVPALQELRLGDRRCELSATALYDQAQHLSGRLLILRDVTVARTIEEDLRRSQAQLAAIIDTAQDAIIVLDDALHIIMFNSGAERLFGRTPAHMLGCTIDAFIPDRVRARHSELIRNFGQTGLSTRTMGHDTVSAVRANGEEFPAEASISKVTVDGRDFYTVILRDVSGRVSADNELRTQKQLFENLVTVARASTARPDLSDTLHNVLRVAVDLTAALRGSLFLVDGDGRVTHTAAVRDSGSADERRTIIGRVMSQGLAGWVVRHQQPALLIDTQADDRWIVLSDELIPTRSALAVPVISGQTLLGALILLHGEVGHFTTDHVRLMQSAADQMALAVRNARLFEGQRRAAERQTTLYEILRTVGSQLERDSVARSAAEAISLLTGWINVAIVLPDAHLETWTVRAVSGASPMTVGLTYPIDRGIIGRAFLTGRVQNVADTRADPDFLFPESPTRSKLVVPLRRGERVVGVLSLDSDQLAHFEADDVSLARSLAEAVALALDNAQLYQTIADETSRLQALIESSRDGIVLLSMEQRVLVINGPALQWLGLPGEPDDWLGRSILDVVPKLRRVAPPLVKMLIREMRRIQHGHEPPGEGEYEIAASHVHWSNLPVLSGAQPVGRLIVLRDVTDERLLSKMRDDLTYTMVHDLRNPLTIIQSALELLITGSAGEISGPQREVLNLASTGAARMLGLVSAILDVTRLESGSMPLEREPTLLDTLVEDALDLQRMLADSKQLTLNNALSDTLPMVSVDVELMSRVFQNLVGNAIKFTPPGGTITVDAHAGADERRMVTVYVCDTGPGLPPEVQAQLFQKFVTGRTKGRGSGLGLVLCRLVVEAHGGRIWAESNPGQGTIFKFTLPTAT